MKRKIRIGISMGDPAGIGPEIIAKAITQFSVSEKVEFIIYGCPDIINRAVSLFAPGIKVNIKETGDLKFCDIIPGQLDKKCGLAALEAVEMATFDCIKEEICAIVTAPLNKAAINLAGIDFTGHTEFIANLCKAKDPVMMQSSGNLRIAFVTTHIPIKEIPEYITTERILRVGKLLNKVIKQEGIDAPKIAMAALNPHAGENGYMGTEEKDIIIPACKKLREMNISVSDPFPPDTLFIEDTLKQYDGIISMYHDQGHIPFKMLAFDTGVNSTLGLPIIRTSVDHGTAFNIAWQGVASPNSLIAAIGTAIKRVPELRFYARRTRKNNSIVFASGRE